ncbi:MAG: anhydro-N-acetylmuramic acid kinase [Chitinophagaceae bacterium]|nr:MAG: anhydro-N-acetylmuramic acid kinase [Chitinophagaceae bacterium]
MNNNISALSNISQKTSRNIIGLMSGTSLDGLDIALCNIEGSGKQMKLKLTKFETIAYNDHFKSEIKSIFSKENVNLQRLTLLNEWIGKTHAAMINDALQKWHLKSGDIDLVASHGQTIYHAPLSLHGQENFGNGTLQIGDGDHIAVNTGIITVSDFRQKHLAAGGEGAPLAAYGDFLIFAEEDKDVMLLNIGGIANFSYLPADNTNRLFSTDVGPGNTLMDALVQEHFPGQYFDKDAAIAKKGSVNHLLLDTLQNNDFLRRPLPKTTGPELFNLSYLEAAKKSCGAEDLSVYDVMATLNRFTAQTIVDAIKPLISLKVACRIYASGGGIHNPLLMQWIKENLAGIEIVSTMEKGIDPDAKEAVLFAILANECVSGNGDSIPAGIKNFPAVTMGKVSFPG